jgi:hypothetical protein
VISTDEIGCIRRCGIGAEKITETQHIAFSQKSWHFAGKSRSCAAKSAFRDRNYLGQTEHFDARLHRICTLAPCILFDWWWWTPKKESTRGVQFPPQSIVMQGASVPTSNRTGVAKSHSRLSGFRDTSARARIA